MESPAVGSGSLRRAQTAHRPVASMPSRRKPLRRKCPSPFWPSEVPRAPVKRWRRNAPARRAAISIAPLIVETLQRLTDGRSRATGIVAAGQAFDARDFLASLSPEPLTLT